MIKQISAKDLRIGMYIHDLNCGWIDHPFTFNRFKIADADTLRKVIATGVKELVIDTAKGLDVADAPTMSAVLQQEKQAFQALLHTPGNTPPGLDQNAPRTPAHQVSIDEELIHAREIAQHANQLISDLMNDAKLGKMLELKQVESLVERMSRSLMRNPDALLSLGRIRQVDQYTFEHSVSVCTLMIAFAHHLGLAQDLTNRIGVGAMLHDIGKVKVPEAVLKKPGKLTDEEFTVMRSHVVHSKLIAAEHPDIDPVSLAVVAQHHERYDGSGYPNHLKGDQISRYGQMAAIADVYDAITTDRCYHTGVAPTQALGMLFKWSRFHFEPHLTQQFIRFIGIYPAGSIVELASGRLGLVLQRNGDASDQALVRILYDTRKKRALTPDDIDLKRAGDSITRYARPEQWGLHESFFLQHLF